MTFDRFREMAANGGLVPVWRELLLDTDTPVSAFAKLRRGPFAFLLESAPAGSETWSRYTFMGTEPRAARRLRDGFVEDWSPVDGWHGARQAGDPLGDLERVVSEFPAVEAPELGAFWSGAVDEVRVSRGARYTKPFKPAPDLAADSSTLFLLSNDHHFGPFVPVTANSRTADSELQAVIKGQAKLVLGE